jgi:hypothetical protein
VTDVAAEVVEPRQPALITHRIHGLSNLTVSNPRYPPRIFRRMTSPFHFFGCKL